MMQDGAQFLTTFTTTRGPFALIGGYYVFVSVTATTQDSSDHMDVKVLGPDGSTYITALAGATSGTTNYVGGYLPPGQYEIVVTGTLASCFAELRRVPLA